MSTSRKRNAAKGLKESAGKAGSPLPDAALNDGEGCLSRANKAVMVVPSPSTLSEAGYSPRAVKAVVEVPASLPNEAKGFHACADKAGLMLPDASTYIDLLAEWQVRRKFYIGISNKQSNAAKALVRRIIGWRYDADEDDREKMNARAARIVAAALAGKEQKPDDAEAFGALAYDLGVVASAIAPCTKARHEIELEMKRVVRKLPVYAWAKSVHGLGELGLAVIIAEAGDLSKYPKKGHLWKRLGLAPFEGKAYSTWRMKGGLTAEQWTDAGYSPRRRAEIYAVISEPLFRAQSVVQGPYRAIYDRRREATAIAHPDWTKAHSHMDALRKMTVILIRDLWKEWRGAGQEVERLAA